MSQVSVERILAFLPALRPEDGFIDLEGDDDQTDKGSDLEYHLMSTRTEQTWDLCHCCCTQLEYERDVIRMCQTFALKIVLGFYLPGHSPLLIAGLSLYMANHLLDLQTDFRRISDVVGVSEGTVRDSYERVYRHRARLFDSQTLVYLASRNMGKTIRVLDWPPL